MTEYLLHYSNEGRWPQWYCDPFRSLEEVCEWLEDGILAGHDLIAVLAVEMEDGRYIPAGSLDVTGDVKERLKQRDQVRMETEYMTFNQPNITLEEYCECNARF